MRRVIPAVLMLALTGCVSLPTDGPVSNSSGSAGTAQPGTFDYSPEGPRPGDGPATIVAGFMDSLRETPLTYAVARKFLTDQGSKNWQPFRRTIVYADGALRTTVVGSRATMELGSSVQLDSRGSWLGDPTHGKGISFELRLERQDDEWRISNPPDALIVSRTHFDTRFVHYDLHFFDPTAHVLVPEPVYLPAGVTLPSLLVSGLLAGPDPRLRSVERTFFPPRTRLAFSVPVQNGVADVPLTDPILDVDPGQLDLALAQLAWTLRQVPGIEKMRVTVDGAPVERTTGASVRSVLGWSAYDPAVPSASSLFAISERNVVAADGGEVGVATTAFGGYSLRSLGASLADRVEDTRLTAVTSDGRRALSLAPATDDPKATPRTVYVGSDLLRPAYDAFARLWLVDRSRSGARVIVTSEARQRELEVEGISGENVSAFEISRDGTRLAAIVDGQLRIARISRSEDGTVTRISTAEQVPIGDGVTGRLVDLGWTTPATLAVLVRLGPEISQVMLASADGSFAVDDAEETLEPLYKRANHVITWPGPDAPVYLETATNRLYSVSSTGHWTPASLPTTLLAPTFGG